MKISQEQLSENINNSLMPVYLISGDEPLLVEETIQQIRQAAKTQQFTEREIWHADAKFDWNNLLASSNSLSLFAEKILIEIRLSSNKLPDAGKKAVLAYLENPPENKTLIIISGKLDGTTQNTKWVKAIIAQGIFLPIWPISAQQLPYWIQKRLQINKMSADKPAISLLAEKTEGNLLATKQEIEKLQLLYGEKHISTEEMIAAISDNAHYDVFSLADSALQGNTKRALKILSGLKGEGGEPILILWALTREIRNLITMSKQLESTNNIDTVLQKNFVWDKRKPIIRSALMRLKSKHLLNLLKRTGQLDRNIKGLAPGNIWDGLNQLTFLMASYG